MSLRKPYREYSCSPVVNLAVGCARLICAKPSVSSGDRHYSHQSMSSPSHALTSSMVYDTLRLM